MTHFKLLFILTLTFFSNLIIAQNYSHDFGILTDYERDIKTYEKDTSADAVIIYDIGESSFYRADQGFDLSFKRRTKIKVLKDSYLNNAEYYIPLYKGSQGKEKIIKFEAVTYNFKDGKVIKKTLDKNQFYTETINKHWDKVKFAMPDVQTGSVIEFKYEVHSPYKFLLKDWEFQSSIPTIYSEYKVKLIPFYQYQYLLQGAKKFDEMNSYKESGMKKQYYDISYHNQIFQFIMKDVPAFKNEQFITSRNDYIMKLDFQLAVIHQYGGGNIDILTTWPKLSQDLENDTEFGTYIKRSKASFKKLSSQLNLASKNDTEKAKAIINYIKQNYNWNGHYGIHATKNVNKFVKEKTGSVAEINLYLIGALKSVGIETYPVILSTRKNGKIVVKYPFIDPFNYVIVYAKINNKPIKFDATDTYSPYNYIPEKCYNDLGLLINKKEPKWLKMVNHKLSTVQINAVSEISPEGDSILADFTFKTTAYEAIKYRKKFQNDDNKIEEYFTKNNLEITDSVRTENYNNAEKDYLIKFKGSLITDRIQNKIIIHPFFFFPPNDNPLKEETRMYPIDMVYPKAKFFSNTIKIPDNFTVEKLPEDFFFNTSLFSLSYRTEQIDNKLIINSSYQFKKAVYTPEEYTKIKRYFNIIIKQLNQKIILDIK